MQSLETKSSRPRPKSFETETKTRPETFETETRSRDSITGNRSRKFWKSLRSSRIFYFRRRVTLQTSGLPQKSGRYIIKMWFTINQNSFTLLWHLLLAFCFDWNIWYYQWQFDCRYDVTRCCYFVCFRLLCKKDQLYVAQRLQLQWANGGYFHCKLLVLSQIFGCNLR